MSQYASDPSWSFLKISNQVISIAKDSLNDVERQFLKYETQLMNLFESISGPVQQNKGRQTESQLSHSTNAHLLTESGSNGGNNTKEPDLACAKNLSDLASAKNLSRKTFEQDMVMKSPQNEFNQPIHQLEHERNENICDTRTNPDHVHLLEQGGSQKMVLSEHAKECSQLQESVPQTNAAPSPIVRRTRSRKKVQQVVIVEPRETRSRRRARNPVASEEVLEKFKSELSQNDSGVNATAPCNSTPVAFLNEKSAKESLSKSEKSPEISDHLKLRSGRKVAANSNRKRKIQEASVDEGRKGRKPATRSTRQRKRKDSPVCPKVQCERSDPVPEKEIAVIVEDVADFIQTSDSHRQDVLSQTNSSLPGLEVLVASTHNSSSSQPRNESADLILKSNTDLLSSSLAVINRKSSVEIPARSSAERISSSGNPACSAKTDSSDREISLALPDVETLVVPQPSAMTSTDLIDRQPLQMDLDSAVMKSSNASPKQSSVVPSKSLGIDIVIQGPSVNCAADFPEYSVRREPILCQSIPDSAISRNDQSVIPSVPRHESLLRSLLDDDNMSDSEDLQSVEHAAGSENRQTSPKTSTEETACADYLNPSESSACFAEEVPAEQRQTSPDDIAASRNEQAASVFPYRFIPPTKSFDTCNQEPMSCCADNRSVNSSAPPTVKPAVVPVKPPSFLSDDSQPLFLSSKLSSAASYKTKKSAPPVSGVLQSLLMKARADSVRRQCSAKQTTSDIATLLSSPSNLATAAPSADLKSSSVQTNAISVPQDNAKIEVLSSTQDNHDSIVSCQVPDVIPAKHVQTTDWKSISQGESVISSISASNNPVSLPFFPLPSTKSKQPQEGKVVDRSNDALEICYDLAGRKDTSPVNQTNPRTKIDHTSTTDNVFIAVNSCPSTNLVTSPINSLRPVKSKQPENEKHLGASAFHLDTCSDVNLQRLVSITPAIKMKNAKSDQISITECISVCPSAKQDISPTLRLPSTKFEQPEKENVFVDDVLVDSCSDLNLKKETSAVSGKSDANCGEKGSNSKISVTQILSDNIGSKTTDIALTTPSLSVAPKHKLSPSTDAICDHIDKAAATVECLPVQGPPDPSSSITSSEIRPHVSGKSTSKGKLVSTDKSGISDFLHEQVFHVCSENSVTEATEVKPELFDHERSGSDEADIRTSSTTVECEQLDTNDGNDGANCPAKYKNVWDTLYNGFNNISTNVASFVRPKPADSKTKRVVEVKALKLASAKRKRDMEKEEEIKLRNKKFQEAGEARKRKVELERQKDAAPATETPSLSTATQSSGIVSKPQEVKKPAERLVELSTEERRKRAEERRLALEEEERRKREEREQQRQAQRDVLRKRRKEEEDASRKKQRFVEEASKKGSSIERESVSYKELNHQKQTVVNAHKFAIPQQPAPRPVLKAKSENEQRNSDPVVEIPSEPDPSDCESDEESDEKELKKKIPKWAQASNLVNSLALQASIDPDSIFNPDYLKSCNLSEIFIDYSNKTRLTRRTSSGNWLQDRLGWREELEYKRRNGFLS